MTPYSNTRWMIILYDDNIVLASYFVYEQERAYQLIKKTLLINSNKFYYHTGQFDDTITQIKYLWHMAQSNGIYLKNMRLNLFLDNLLIYQIDKNDKHIKQIDKNNSSWLL